MILFLRLFLPIYSIVFFGLIFIYQSIRVSKQIGKNPMVLPKDDSAYGLVSAYFKLITALLILYVIGFGLAPDWVDYFGRFKQLELVELQVAGVGAWLIAFFWVMIAQRQMRNSWRIGIDSDQNTELITGGLFQVSRNPIFSGLIVNFVGLFLITPNIFTLMIMIVGTIIIQFQVRLEEQHLTNLFSDQYLDYKKRVRRFI